MIPCYVGFLYALVCQNYHFVGVTYNQKKVTLNTVIHFNWSFWWYLNEVYYLSNLICQKSDLLMIQVGTLYKTNQSHLLNNDIKSQQQQTLHTHTSQLFSKKANHTKTFIPLNVKIQYKWLGLELIYVWAHF